MKNTVVFGFNSTIFNNITIKGSVMIREENSNMEVNFLHADGKLIESVYVDTTNFHEMPAKVTGIFSDILSDVQIKYIIGGIDDLFNTFLDWLCLPEVGHVVDTDSRVEGSNILNIIESTGNYWVELDSYENVEGDTVLYWRSGDKHSIVLNDETLLSVILDKDNETGSYRASEFTPTLEGKLTDSNKGFVIPLIGQFNSWYKDVSASLVNSGTMFRLSIFEAVEEAGWK